MKQFLLLVVTVLYSIAGSSQQVDWHGHVISELQFEEDITTLYSFLKQNHGGFDRYADQTMIDAHFRDLSAIDDSVSYAEAYYRCASLIDQLHDGHTWVMPPEKACNDILRNEVFIPFTVRVNGTGMFIDQSFSDHPLMTEGREILSVNGKKVREVVTQLIPYFTTDGFSLNGKLGAMEGQFWWYYGLHFGFPSSHLISVATHDGEQEIELSAVQMGEKITRVSQIYTRYAGDEKEPITFEIKEKIGILHCNSFAGWSLNRFERQIDEAFTSFREHGCERLVIDLRGNGGGREGVENLILSYLPTNFEEKYDEVAIKAPIASDYSLVNDPMKRRLEDIIYRTFEFRRDDEGVWVRRDRFNRTFIVPDSRFDGEVFVLIDRNVFSGAAELAALIDEFGVGCTLVGEETCGGYQGHTSGYYYRIELPNSHFVVQVPRIWFDLNVSGDHRGGVLPDIVIHQDPTSPRQDRVLEFALSAPLAEGGK